MQRKSYRCCWSGPAPLNRSSNGRLRVGWGQCPGVAIVAHEDLHVEAKRPKTKAAQRWVCGGRLLLAQALIASIPVLLINMYSHSGHEKEAERRELFHDVYQEICAQESFHYLLGADFNSSAVSNALSALLIPQGAGIPRWITPTGEATTVTYTSGEAYSCIDSFLSGPDIHMSESQVVHNRSGCPHALITVDMRCDCVQQYPRIQPQVMIRKRELSEQSTMPMAWTDVHDAIERLVRTTDQP